MKLLTDPLIPVRSKRWGGVGTFAGLNPSANGAK